MSLISRLAAWNERAGNEVRARGAGYDPATAKLIGDLIAARIRAQYPPCPYDAHPVPCMDCAAARTGEACAVIAERTGGLW